MYGRVRIQLNTSWSTRTHMVVHHQVQALIGGSFARSLACHDRCSYIHSGSASVYCDGISKQWDWQEQCFHGMTLLAFCCD